MNNWFFYFLKKAVSQRIGRFVIASSAVMLSVTVVTALVTLSLGMRDKIGRELRQYGANMIVTDAAGIDIEDAVAREIGTLSGYIKDAAFQLYYAASVKDTSVEIIGIEPDRMSGYRLQGRLPHGENDLMVGVNLKGALQAQQGGVMHFDNGKTEYHVSAIFEKGSHEDSSIVMTIEAARKLSGKKGVSSALLNADTQRLKEVEDAIRARFPFLQVKTIRQVAVAEERILGRIQLLMLLVTGVVLLSSIIALGSTMGANVIERMEEIGLMKSIGAAPRDIRKFFMSEAALAGFMGAVAGYFIGVVAAETVSKTAFGSFISANIFAAPLSVIFGVLIAVISTYFPVRDAMRAVPAKILRGE